MIYVCEREGLKQTLMVGDLECHEDRNHFTNLLGSVDLVYSDPPWSPGNATYWRTHAGEERCESYEWFLSAWCGVVSECIGRGAEDVLTEQSANDRHRQMLLDEVARWSRWPPLAESWTVYYGSPGSRSVQRPNILLRFGDKSKPLVTDPSGMAGEAMTIRVCAGLMLPPESTIVDPCMGKGMTSRMAHYFQWNAFGFELNPKRLRKTVEWLEKRGYSVKEVSP